MKKKGFTLIELLAVIVILAIIALIAVPVIMNIINSARESAFEDTTYGLISAGEMYYASSLLENGMTSDVEFTIEEGEFVGENKLEVKGSLPQTGKIKVTRDGKVALAITNGAMCITKGYDDSKIDLNEDVDNCVLPKEQTINTLNTLAVASSFTDNVIASCLTSGTTCPVGTKFTVQVNETETKNFYVISDNDNKVTLLMDTNIGEDVSWISNSDYGLTDNGCLFEPYECASSDKGPSTALNYLESQTSSWTNIPNFNYTYIDENTPKAYDDIFKKGVKARLLTHLEANAIVQNEWAHGYYWLSTSVGYNSSSAWLVENMGTIVSSNVNDSCGVRPIIEIAK